MSDKDIKKSGWLIKEGAKWHTWKKRFFSLEDGYVTYKKTPTARAHLGKFSLEDVTHIKPTNARPKKSHCFEMPTADRTYYICAATGEEMQDWITALRLAKQAKLEKMNPQTEMTDAKPSQSNMGMNMNDKMEPSANSNAKRVGIEDFELLKVIGKGSFGKVLLAKKLDDQKVYAMKVLDKKSIIEKDELKHTRAERNILQKLDCPFLVKLHYTFQTTDKLYFIMDFINGGELFFHLQNDRKFDNERVRFYCAEIVLGLKYLHEKGILYRDLKPENVLITADGHICMTDFGISKEGLSALDDRTATFCGTPEYLAPEVLEGVEYGKAIDWWSFGTLMFEMLTGLPPFYSQDVQVMYQKIMTAKLTIPDNITTEAASLLKHLLERNPEKRLQEPKEIMSHPYFEGIDWEKLNAKQISPPYIPEVNSDTSTAMIDPSFTQEDPVIEQDEDTNGINQDGFRGFTYDSNTGNALNK